MPADTPESGVAIGSLVVQVEKGTSGVTVDRVELVKPHDLRLLGALIAFHDSGQWLFPGIYGTYPPAVGAKYPRHWFSSRRKRPPVPAEGAILRSEDTENPTEYSIIVGVSPVNEYSLLVGLNLDAGVRGTAQGVDVFYHAEGKPYRVRIDYDMEVLYARKCF